MLLEYHDFRAADLVGGDHALDFVNTVTARDTEPRDWLNDFDAWVRWARESKQYAASELGALARLAAEQPNEAQAALKRAKFLREALCEVFYALIAGRKPAADHLQTIDEARIASSTAAQFVSRKRHVEIDWSAKRSGLDLITHVVSARAVALLAVGNFGRIRVCDGRHCGWVFADTSKSGRRRWCDMATCGNVAKARRFAKARRV